MSAKHEAIGTTRRGDLMNEPANYEKKLRAMLDRGELTPRPGVATHINVAHDDWCAIYAGGRCNCDPDIQVIEDEIQ